MSFLTIIKLKDCTAEANVYAPTSSPGNDKDDEMSKFFIQELLLSRRILPN